jgi:hypothetical protein
LNGGCDETRPCVGPRVNGLALVRRLRLTPEGEEGGGGGGGRRGAEQRGSRVESWELRVVVVGALCVGSMCEGTAAAAAAANWVSKLVSAAIKCHVKGFARSFGLGTWVAYFLFRVLGARWDGRWAMRTAVGVCPMP